jgi:hypothetical protein
MKLKEMFVREGVGTSKITTSKGQNIESFFEQLERQKCKRSQYQKFDQNVKNQNIKKNIESQRKLDFQRSDLFLVTP